MDRELLLEIGCEELPAGWLPGLTNQIGEIVDAQLRAHRLPPESPVETYSTPRRLTVRIVRIPERQSDLEELLNGPPVSASFKPDGSPTPAAAGFAAKNGVEVSALERLHTPKGEYLAFRRRQRGKATVDVLPDVLRDSLRALQFPKAMRWDAMLEDGKGDLLFGRPIRWLLYLYGGRVVPFTIARTPAAQTSQVQDVSTGAVTYGHRFLTTSGRAGRAIKVRSFDEYRARLLENFVILERSERHNKIARELDAKAQRLQGRVSRTVNHETGLLLEVPDLVEYPSVVAGTFALEFLELPEEVLTTTLIHHQHYFPVEGDDGRLKNAFLAVINTEPDNERTIARNAERVVTARLRDAKFFWDADVQIDLNDRLDAQLERLATIQFHRKLGSYRDKATRLEGATAEIATSQLKMDGSLAYDATRAGKLAKVDLTTQIVGEFPELQGNVGGLLAKRHGYSEAVWKAIYFQYLPQSVEADSELQRKQLGSHPDMWAALSLADKLDTLVGMFSIGEKPTGSRDPFALRRAGHGVIRLLVDLQQLTGNTARPKLNDLIAIVSKHLALPEATTKDSEDLLRFFAGCLRHLMQSRGLEYEEIQAVTGTISRIGEVNLADLVDRAMEIGKVRSLPVFASIAEAYKRAKNLVESASMDVVSLSWGMHEELLTEPAERDLKSALVRMGAEIRQGLDARQPSAALKAIASIQPQLAKFFTEVRVIVDDQDLKEARLSLLAEIRDRIEEIGDLSVLAPKQA